MEASGKAGAVQVRFSLDFHLILVLAAPVVMWLLVEFLIWTLSRH